jgi:hypothetical protein
VRSHVAVESKEIMTRQAPSWPEWRFWTCRTREIIVLSCLVPFSVLWASEKLYPQVCRTLACEGPVAPSCTPELSSNPKCDAGESLCVLKRLLPAITPYKLQLLCPDLPPGTLGSFEYLLVRDEEVLTLKLHSCGSDAL